MGSSLVKPNMIPLPLPPRRTIPSVSQIIWNTVRNPHILDNEGYSNISDNILISAWPVQLRDICGPIFPQGQLPFPKLYFIVGAATRQGAQMLRTYTRWTIESSDFGSWARNVPTMTLNSWGVSLSNKFILDTICPQMWKYACSVEVIDESSSGRSGDASSEFVPSPTFTFTCAQCRANYCN